MVVRAWAFAQSALSFFLEGVYIVLSALSYICSTGILRPYIFTVYLNILKMFQFKNVVEHIRACKEPRGSPEPHLRNTEWEESHFNLMMKKFQVDLLNFSTPARIFLFRLRFSQLDQFSIASFMRQILIEQAMTSLQGMAVIRFLMGFFNWPSSQLHCGYPLLSYPSWVSTQWGWLPLPYGGLIATIVFRKDL